MNDEQMTISKAIEILKDKKSQTSDAKVQNRIDSLINDLYEYFGNGDCVEPEIAEELNDINTRIFQPDYGWVMALHEKFVLMKRRSECKKYLADHGNKIDGETAQWATTWIQGFIGLFSIVFTFLFAYGVIPDSLFGTLGDSQNTDALYYIIGTFGQQIVALVIAIVVGIINSRHRKSKYADSEYSFEELLAVKYADSPVKLSLISPAARKIRDNQIIIGNGNTQIIIGKQKAKSIENNF